MKIIFAVGFLLLTSIQLEAQSSADSTIKVNAQANSSELLDTDETFLYVGEKMLYQIKKKLHLSDEEDDKEEKERKEKAKNAKFSIFGITIEK